MADAFSFRAASPVVITAPVSTSSGLQPAPEYERSMNLPSASVSMRRSETYGEHHLGAMHRGALDDGIGARKTDALTL